MRTQSVVEGSLCDDRTVTDVVQVGGGLRPQPGEAPMSSRHLSPNQLETERSSGTGRVREGRQDLLFDPDG